MKCNSPTGYHSPYETQTFLFSNKTKRTKYRCDGCKTEIVILRLPDGSMYNEDHKLYMEYHAQDYLQADHPDYEKVYGIENKQNTLKEFHSNEKGRKESKERKERVEERKEHYKNNKLHL